jgi:hypothetical protein
METIPVNNVGNAREPKTDNSGAGFPNSLVSLENEERINIVN